MKVEEISLCWVCKHASVYTAVRWEGGEMAACHSELADRAPLQLPEQRWGQLWDVSQWQHSEAPAQLSPANWNTVAM